MVDSTFRVKNQYLNDKVTKLMTDHKDELTDEQFKILQLILLKFKKYSNNEDFVYFIIVYSMYYFGHISADSPYLSDTHRKYLHSMKDSLKAEMNKNLKEYLTKMLEMHDDLFLLKVIIKSIILNEPEKFWVFVPDIKQYYRSIWRIIPVLSYKEYPKLLNIYQDKYFEKVYNSEFNWTKNTYQETIAKIDVVENFMVDVINDLNRLMEILWVYWRVTVRRKSYFSIYNKLKRKDNGQINDFIWVRIVFKTEEELFKFAKMFEDKFVIVSKKNYIKNPKESWYQSLHYNFVYYYENVTKNIELQLRTEEMNEQAHRWHLGHFTYSLDQNKWDPLFKEVQEWLEVLKEININPWNRHFWVNKKETTLHLQ